MGCAVVLSAAIVAQTAGSAVAQPGATITAEPFPITVENVTDTNGNQVQFRMSPYTQVEHRWQVPGGWSAWSDLGAYQNGMIRGTPAATVSSDGALSVFAVDYFSGELTHRWQLYDGGPWSQWISLGGELTSNPDVTRKASEDVMVVFGNGTDQSLYHIWQESPHGNWKPWSSLGQPSGHPLEGPPLVPQFADVLSVTSIASGHTTWFRTQRSNGGLWNNWVQCC
jgi:hypothetical protein